MKPSLNIPLALPVIFILWVNIICAQTTKTLTAFKGLCGHETTPAEDDVWQPTSVDDGRKEAKDWACKCREKRMLASKRGCK